MAKKPSANAAKSSPGKLIYYFGQTKTEGKGVGKDILGGKGANLAEMTSIGLPVPPGLTITTTCCKAYYDEGRRLPGNLMEGARQSTKLLEKGLGRTFGYD